MKSADRTVLPICCASLSVIYNRVRQAAITQQIAEVVGRRQSTEKEDQTIKYERDS